MIKLYIGSILENMPVVELIRPNLKVGGLDRWTERHVQLSERVVEIAITPDEADALLIPHNFNYIKSNIAYINHYEKIGERTGKKILVFFPGDSSESVNIKNVIVFRNSVYRSKLLPNEIVLPGYVADLGQGVDLKPRYKNLNGTKAVIGFCGWADLKGLFAKMKFMVKNQSLDGLYRQGLWWRRKLIEILNKSQLVQTNFIIRKSYSGNEKTIGLDPEQAKKEYIENILKSDLTLCVKGDGNFSTRFFEVMALGRIPLFFDTETVLPLEDIIDYGNLMVKVLWQDWKRADRIAAEYFENIDPTVFMEIQVNNRRIFEKFLRLDSYFKYVFGAEYIRKYLV